MNGHRSSKGGSNRRKGKKKHGTASEGAFAVHATSNNSNMESDDDESSFNDDASVISYQSSRLEEEVGEVGTDDVYIDDFEGKLIEAIDSASEKSSKGRHAALDSISRAFTTRYMYDFIFDRKVTILDLIERSLKRGKGEEVGSAAILASVVCITLGPGDETEILFSDIKSLLMTVLNDATNSPTTRTKAATSLGLICLITDSNEISTSAIMDSLVTIFSGSFLKGNGTLPAITPLVSSLHAAALNSWTLLLTISSTSTVHMFSDKYSAKIMQLLQSPDVALRITAGECLAVMNEILTSWDESYELDNFTDLIDTLHQLATDSQKFRAKKDRRIQRSTFRDVLKSIENNEPPSEVIKFGRERLIIDSWCRKKQYDTICYLLSSGMNHHLSENDLLRDIFDLGSPLSSENGTTKMSKFERHMENLAVSRARTKVRGKLRDKRADTEVAVA